MILSMFQQSCLLAGFPDGSAVKNLPAMQETRVRSLGWEDALEEGMAIHSSILAWRIPWTEEPGTLQSMESQRVGHNWRNGAHTHRLFATWMAFWWNVCSNLLSVHFLITLWTWNSHPYFCLSSSPPMGAVLSLPFPHCNHRFFLYPPIGQMVWWILLCGMYYASILNLQL